MNEEKIATVGIQDEDHRKVIDTVRIIEAMRSMKQVLADQEERNRPVPREDKGLFNGHCNRTQCDNDEATWYNHGTGAYYCHPCAKRINQSCEGEQYWPLCMDKKEKKETFKPMSPLLASMLALSGYRLPSYGSKPKPKMNFTLEEMEELRTLGGKDKKQKIKELKEKYGN